MYKLAPCTATSTTCIVARSPALTVVFGGSGTCGRQKVPGYGPFDGPVIWKTGTSGKLKFSGPWSGPSVSKPMLMYMKAVACPWNQPGCMAIAPPLMGQVVRLREVPMPPPVGG